VFDIFRSVSISFLSNGREDSGVSMKVSNDIVTWDSEL